MVGHATPCFPINRTSNWICKMISGLDMAIFFFIVFIVNLVGVDALRLTHWTWTCVPGIGKSVITCEALQIVGV